MHLMIMSVIIKCCYAEKNTRLLKATNVIYVLFCQGRRGLLPMQSVLITTDIVNSNLDQGEVYNII